MNESAGEVAAAEASRADIQSGFAGQQATLEERNKALIGKASDYEHSKRDHDDILTKHSNAVSEITKMNAELKKFRDLVNSTSSALKTYQEGPLLNFESLRDRTSVVQEEVEPEKEEEKGEEKKEAEARIE